MQTLDFTRKDGSTEHITDVSYFTIREVTDYVDGEEQVVGAAMYYERTDDEIGKGTLIDMDAIASYQINENSLDKEIIESAAKEQYAPEEPEL